MSTLIFFPNSSHKKRCNLSPRANILSGTKSVEQSSLDFSLPYPLYCIAFRRSLRKLTLFFQKNKYKKTSSNLNNFWTGYMKLKLKIDNNSVLMVERFWHFQSKNISKLILNNNLAEFQQGYSAKPYLSSVLKKNVPYPLILYPLKGDT